MRVAFTTAVLAFASMPGLGAEMRWKLATADTEIEIGVQDNAPAVLALHAPGVAWNWTPTANRESLPKSVTQAGAPHTLQWSYVRHEYDPSNGVLTLVFQNSKPALELKSIWKAPRGRGPIEHWQLLKNASGERLTIESQPSLSLDALALPLDQYVESTQVSARRERSSDIRWHDHPARGQDLEHQGSEPALGWRQGGLPRRGFDDPDSVSQSAGGRRTRTLRGLEVFGGRPDRRCCQWHDGGRGQHQLDRLVRRTDAGLSARTSSQERNSSCRPRSSARIAASSRRARTRCTVTFWIRCCRGSRRARPSRPWATPTTSMATCPARSPRPIVLASVRLAHELGFETYLADAMWFPQTGDWRWDAKRFPRGAKPIADYLHANGMKFGLWMAWTHAQQFRGSRVH